MNQAATLLRMTAKWNTKAAAAYEAAAVAIENGAESLTPEQRQAFISAGSNPPRSLRIHNLVSALRQAVYNASTSANLTANQNSVDAELAALGITE